MSVIDNEQHKTERNNSNSTKEKKQIETVTNFSDSEIEMSEEIKTNKQTKKTNTVVDVALKRLNTKKAKRQSFFRRKSHIHTYRVFL